EATRRACEAAVVPPEDAHEAMTTTVATISPIAAAQAAAAIAVIRVARRPYGVGWSPGAPARAAASRSARARTSVTPLLWQPDRVANGCDAPTGRRGHHRDDPAPVPASLA